MNGKNALTKFVKCKSKERVKERDDEIDIIERVKERDYNRLKRERKILID